MATAGEERPALNCRRAGPSAFAKATADHRSLGGGGQAPPAARAKARALRRRPGMREFHCRHDAPHDGEVRRAGRFDDIESDFVSMPRRIATSSATMLMAI